VSTLIAYDRENPRTIFGWACIEQLGRVLALHYAYTRHSHWKMGVCSELLRHALQGASDADALVYTAGSRFDALWERWGFRRVQLEDWLRQGGAVKDLTRPDIRLRERGKVVKRGGVR
jgi:hypothetical protein